MIIRPRRANVHRLTMLASLAGTAPQGTVGASGTKVIPENATLFEFEKFQDLRDRHLF
jgi:hypothetical protein